MKKTIDVKAGTVTFAFEGADGKIDPALTVVFTAAKMAQANKDYGLLHGMSARIGDNAAIQRKGADGKVITVTEEMRRREVLNMVAHYENPANEDWNLKAAPRAEPMNPAILAIAAKLGKSYAEAQAWYNEKLMAELAAMEG